MTSPSDPELARRASENERFIERITEASPHIMYVFDIPSMRNVYANRMIGHDLGYSPAEIQAMGDEFLPRLVHPDDLARLPDLFRRWETALDGEVFETHYRMRHRDGSWHWFVGRDTVFTRDDDGRVTQFIGTAKDVTDRKLAEHEMLASKRMLELVMNNIPQGVFWKDRDSRYLGCNRVVAEVLGLDSPADIVGRFDADLPSVTPEQAAFFIMKDRRVIESGVAEHGIHEPMTLADGSTVWLETSKLPLHNAEGEVIGVVGTWQDVTERLRTQEALQASERRYHTTLASIGDAVIATDAAGRVTFCNPVAESLTGWPCAEAVGRPLDEMLPLINERTRQPVENPALQALRYRTSVGLANGTLLRRRDGREVPIEDSAAPIRSDDGEVTGVVLVFRDVTAKRQAEEQRRRLETQLLHAQKLESLGVLAGGIAHDFNNLLTGILGYTNLAALQLPEDSTARFLLAEAEKTANRATELVSQLLAYAGKGRFAVEAVNLNTVAGEMLALLRPLVSSKARVRTSFAANLPLTEADVTQVRQVVMNLITNASEALGRREGDVVLSTGVEYVEDPKAYSPHSSEEARPGMFVFVEVSDTGCGMSAETLARMFDPFFTTKFSGRGLGLAAVLGIVRGHRGILKITSEEGEGTQFRVLFPRAESARAPEQAVAVRRVSQTPGVGSVLVVDDEEAVRSLAARVLSDAGYQVIVAGDGEEGLAAFRVAGSKIRAVVMDLTMPGLDGLEATRQLYELRADVPVLLMSGYGEPHVVQSLAGMRFAGFLQKPFIADALLAALREALERSG